MHKTLDDFSNILPDDVKDCLVLIDLLITLSPSTAKCERGFSTMTQLKNSTRPLTNQDTLTALKSTIFKSQCDQLLCYFRNSTLDEWSKNQETHGPLKSPKECTLVTFFSLLYNCKTI